MSLTLEQFGIDRLAVSERLELVELIWESVEDSGVPTPLADWQLRELEKRIAAADADPGAGIPFEIAKARWLAGSLSRP